MQITSLFRLAAALAFASLSRVVSSQQAAESACPATAPSCRAFNAYLDAFSRHDWNAFRATLADDITVMFDEPGPGARVDGRTAVETIFKKAFPPPGATGVKPFSIVPEDLRWQDYGDAAVVSFVLRDTDEGRTWHRSG